MSIVEDYRLVLEGGVLCEMPTFAETMLFRLKIIASIFKVGKFQPILDETTITGTLVTVPGAHFNRGVPGTAADSFNALSGPRRLASQDLRPKVRSPAKNSCKTRD